MVSYFNYNILKNVDIYTFELSKFMYLYREQSPPEIFDAYVLRIEQAHHYNTRSKYHQNYYLKIPCEETVERNR